MNFDADRTFEKKASGVLRELYESEPKMAYELLERPLLSWDEHTVLTVADAAQQMDFMEHECCQTKLNKKWFGKVATYTTMWQASLI